MKKKFILAALLTSVCMAAHAAFVPVALTGFNEDIIANGSGPCAASVSADFTNGTYSGMDGHNYMLVAQDYLDPNDNSPQHYLPTGGVVTSTITPGLTFQLGDYSQNNALFITQDNTTDSFTLPFVTPMSGVGALYVCGLAAQSSWFENAVFSVYVNFSDGTSQLFPYNFFYDWFDSTSAPVSVPGIGRVYLLNGITDSGATGQNPHLLQLGLNLADTNYSKTITGVSITYVDAGGSANLAIMGITANTVCSGTPNAGTVTENIPSACNDYNHQLSMTGTTADGGIAYQWQSSADGINFTNVAGATNAVYTATVLGNIYYRDSVSCQADSLWNISAPLALTRPFTVATLPYFQNFENWIGDCYSYDRPDSNFILNPATGNNSWRRDDEGSDASWDNPNAYDYSPSSSSFGSHSARFHSTIAADGAEGDMDLHVNLGAPGAKEISFDYINGDGTDYLKVELSEDGGHTFTGLDTIGTHPFGWQLQHITTTSVAANAVIRFAAVAQHTYLDFTDIGIDSLAIFVQTACNGMPADTIAATQVSGCAAYTSQLSLTNDFSTGLTYQWDSSTNGTDYTTITGATSITYTANVTENVFYRARIVCTNSADTAYTQPVSLIITSPVASTATLPYFQSFENWIGTCYNYDRPDSNWLLNPTYGNNSWRKNNEGYDAGWTLSVAYSYSPASSDGNYSARFHSGYTLQNVEGDMDLHIDLSQPGTKEISFDYINPDGTDYLRIKLSEDGGLTFNQIAIINTDTANWTTEHIFTSSVAANAVIRFAGIADYGNTDIGIDSLSITDLPACNGTPSAGTFSNTGTNWCTPYISYLQIDTPINLAFNGIVYQWQSSADGVTFTDIPGATGINYDATVNADTFYRFKTICTASGDSSFSPATEFLVTPVQASIATLPYFQGFENWKSDCSSFDRPDSNWMNTPVTGQNSWRREDQGNYANWYNPVSDGLYTPVSIEGDHSARFSSYNAPYGTVGDLDLHINLAVGTDKTLSFYYIDSSGTDYLNVMLSLDSGATFNTLTTLHISSNGTWQHEAISLPYYSPHAILRFSAVSDYGYTDIGIDSLYISTSPCSSITGLAVSGISPDAATATWTAVSLSAGYEILVDQSPSDPAGAGIGVTTNAYPVNSLLSNTTYYVHVRDSCGPDDLSAWATTSFTTTNCDSITGLSVNNISDVGATVSWNAIAGTAGYEYAITPTYAVPTVKTGTLTAAFIKTNLLPSTTYYVFVRDSCGPGSYSGWDTLSFTTLPNEGVHDVNGTFDVNVYPNPSHNMITVQAYGMKGNIRKVSLTDITGRTIATKDMITDRIDFKINDLASGIYLIRYEDEEHTKTIKVNKQ